MIYKNLKKIQAHILRNYNNTSYQKISGDTYFENIPSELYELWYSPHIFSFMKFKDIKDIPYLKGKVLLRYYFNIVKIFIKINTIFKKMKGGLSHG